MKPELQALLRKQRKVNRDVLELRQLAEKMRSHKNPDTKLLKTIEDEISNLTATLV